MGIELVGKGLPLEALDADVHTKVFLEHGLNRLGHRLHSWRWVAQREVVLWELVATFTVTRLGQQGARLLWIVRVGCFLLEVGIRRVEPWWQQAVRGYGLTAQDRIDDGISIHSLRKRLPHPEVAKGGVLPTKGEPPRLELRELVELRAKLRVAFNPRLIGRRDDLLVSTFDQINLAVLIGGED